MQFCVQDMRYVLCFLSPHRVVGITYRFEQREETSHFKSNNQDSMDSCLSGMASKCHDLARTLKDNNIRVEARTLESQNGLKSVCCWRCFTYVQICIYIYNINI